MTPPRHDADMIVVGAGIVGAASARAGSLAGLRVLVVERDMVGSGATAAGMGHVVVMDDSPAQWALTRYAQELWRSLAHTLPAGAEYRETGTLWVAADEEELAEVERKAAFLRDHGVPGQALSASELAAAEPSLRPGLAGALLVEQDSVVYPPVVAAAMLAEAEAHGARVVRGDVIRAMHGRVDLADRRVFHAEHLVLATGTAPELLPDKAAVRKRKGHLLITESYPGFLRHQLVELGYLKSAHATEEDSVAFNVQPRATGQLLIGSSRQFGDEDAAIRPELLARMLTRAVEYLPALAEVSSIRTWTGFRAATPDKLPLIGPASSEDRTLLLATGHEGLGITTSLGTAELLLDGILGRVSAIPREPYLPGRFEAAHA